MKYAKIWVSVPDVLDGYFVEIIESHKTLDFQMDSAWFPTVEQCEIWARSQGATRIETL